MDCLRPRVLWLLPVLLPGIPRANCQEKLQTPQQTNEKIQAMAETLRARPLNTPIGTGDLLRIDVFDVPDLSREVRVDQSGEISFPLIPGRIQAGGLTAFELEEKLESLLIENGLVSHPQVSVFVKEQNSQPVSVIGAVSHPQVYQVFRPTTLLEILAAAGGLADDAGSVVLVIRPTAGDPPKPATADRSGDHSPESETVTIKLKDLLESGDSKFNIPIYGGDVVSVPRSGIVYVAGAVQQPGGFVLQERGEQITTLKAVALAHGLLGTSKPNQAVIVRANPSTGQREEIPVRLKTIMQRKAEDVRMYPNDLLFVPDSTGKKVLARSGEAMLGITTGLVILRASH